MKSLNVQNVLSTSIKATCLMMFMFVFSINAEAQKDKKNQKADEVEKSGVAFDFYDETEEEINILKTFLHANQDAFSITIYDFKGEKVQVIIYDSKTNEKLYSLNVEPTEDIANVELLTKPLSKGTYYVIVKGESRVIPKQMVID